jgi:hypothetical protein
MQRRNLLAWIAAGALALVAAPATAALNQGCPATRKPLVFLAQAAHTRFMFHSEHADGYLLLEWFNKGGFVIKQQRLRPGEIYLLDTPVGANVGSLRYVPYRDEFCRYVSVMRVKR